MITRWIPQRPKTPKTLLFQALLLAAAGSLTAFAFAPYFWLPLYAIGFSFLFAFLTRPPLGNSLSAFWVGWWFGLGHFTAGLWWIAQALLVEPERFWWLIPFSVLGIPSLLSFFTGAATYLFAQLKLKGLAGWMAFAVCWSMAEFLRGTLCTGFPWNLSAYIWAFHPAPIQVSAWVGSYGLSLLTILMATWPALWWAVSRKEAWKATYISLAIISLQLSMGWYRLHQAEAIPTSIQLRLVQANIPQRLKWNTSWVNHNLSEYLRLSQTPASTPIHILIWPETATPFFLEQDAAARHVIQPVIPSGGYLITGALRSSFVNHSKRYWNSMLVLDDQSRIVGRYDKSHLVPFGEYIPLRAFLEKAFPSQWLTKITPGVDDFSEGPGRKTLLVPGIPPLSPLVCYEIIFPGEVIDDKAPPSWMLNVTNDAWYGQTPGPYQHLVSTQMRAVEEGIPVVRAANTGVSAVIDSYGRIVGHIPLETQGVLDIKLPQALKEATPFRQHGPIIFYGMVIILGLIIRQCHKKEASSPSDTP